jgi:hypothetical protein
MDAQEMHDYQLSLLGGRIVSKKSRAKLEKMLVDKSKIAASDPIEQAMKNHPGLTREEAERWAEAFGF